MGIICVLPPAITCWEKGVKRKKITIPLKYFLCDLCVLAVNKNSAIDRSKNLNKFITALTAWSSQNQLIGRFFTDNGLPQWGCNGNTAFFNIRFFRAYQLVLNCFSGVNVFKKHPAAKGSTVFGKFAWINDVRI